MPQRTNDFQQLVHMIEKAFAPVGAKVTESAMVPGRSPGTMREIDILIETNTGPYRIKAVEAKDEKEPLDVIAVEGIAGKYFLPGAIHVDKLVIVSRRGFSKEARTCAEQVGTIELFVLDEVTQSDWTRLAPQNIQIRIPPHIDRIELVPNVRKKGKRDPLVDGRFICNCHGKDKGSPQQWADWFQVTQVTPSQQLKEFMEQEAKRQNGEYRGKVSWPINNHTLLFEGRKYAATELVIHLHCVNATGNVNWSSHDYKSCIPISNGKTVDQMEGVAGGKRIRTLFPSGPTSERVILRVDSAPVDNASPPSGSPSSFTFDSTQAPVCPGAWSKIRPIPAPRPVSPNGHIGRNDPCPCGSGKKFKYCCLKKSAR
jgi:hypothetical protein